ncbi:MAG: proton-conducting transporter membrane subunit [Methylovulum sp.]|nr:proton-conducting transporter membrane subunit [Methylovulum sp.]
MDALVILIPLLPLLAAVAIGSGHTVGLLRGEAGETATADMAGGAITLSFLMALALLCADGLGKNAGFFGIGQWLGSDNLDIRINFVTTGLPVRLATLFALLLAIVCRFSINYLHREAGFHRFFFVLSLFAAAMLLLVLSANAVGTFIGWEIAGLCSYLLIAYAYHRPVATQNATRAYVTNRIGDAGFIIGIGLCYAWVGSVNWSQLNAAAEQLTIGEATGISLCFALAAFAKSAQLPFTPWLARAMEGPTPSSAVFYGAVMVHSGVYLVCLLAPIFSQSPFAMAVLGLVGFFTALYSFIVGQTQTDIKSSLVFATSGQLGLMFLECGLGLWQLASWHICAHAIVRCWLILSAPSLLHNLRHTAMQAKSQQVSGWLYMVSLQQFWLDQIVDWALVKPIRGLAHDLSYFDDHIIDRIMGVPTPAIGTLSSLAQVEEEIIGAKLSDESDEFARGSGLAGKLTEWAAAVVHWFEDRFVLRGIGKDAIHYGRQLGHAANKFEQIILRPRYLVLFVCITFLVAF